MITIGFLELNSIAKGIEAADAMLKTAQVRLVTAKPSCPGKYHILISGEVAAVQSSLDAGETIGQANVVDKLIIPRVHPQVIEAINMTTLPQQVNAVGVLEFFSVTASIQGADAAVKAADVTLLEVRLGTGIGGKSYVIMTGEVAAVQASVDAGAKQGEENGMLVSKVVIPSPHMEIFQTLY
ncbi:BMC domain-containing protein [Youxingia wuxianensis]|uniref:BMC domain-containing protein n=1 Tax=Youxingia wuxianensis TaxID=2763678 RepID=A0A926ERW9_9FIRM|nr:BMC domain-containing protein [Youxingia wuxianensis]MBC8585234.1 BMC domain-containing protein [Youxingia wuxianensis]